MNDLHRMSAQKDVSNVLCHLCALYHNAKMMYPPPPPKKKCGGQYIT